MRAASVLLLCSVIASPLAHAADAAPAPITVAVAGKPALKLTVPAGWKSVATGDVTTLLPPEGAPHVQLWPVAGAATVAAAEAIAAATIVPQVKDFTVAKRSELTVAGAPAVQLTGTGTEADDGDPANAEVTLFTVGGAVYVLCAHGEGDGTAKRHDDLLKALATVAAPGRGWMAGWRW
jgi:hypothetical protein